MNDEKKIKAGREPLYQHNQPVEFLNLPVEKKRLPCRKNKERLARGKGISLSDNSRRFCCCR